MDRPAAKEQRRQSNQTALTATDMETNLARQGSNFGLPIALQLAVLMKGGIGIVEASPHARSRSVNVPTFIGPLNRYSETAGILSHTGR
jgi:hypothetical protein